MADFDLKLLVTSDCTKLTKRRKNARKQALTRQQPFKKAHVGVSESNTLGALFLDKVFCGLWSRLTLAVVSKIKTTKCHRVPI